MGACGPGSSVDPSHVTQRWQPRRVQHLITPAPGRDDAEAFVAENLGHLICDEVAGSTRFHGGQMAADGALAGFDVTGYASRRNEVLPESRRGASALSPYIRHGLLTLREVWDHVAGGPTKDVQKYRDELLWQEYSRHLYARLGARMATGLRHELQPAGRGRWDRSMACVDAVVDELHRDGWLVNQTRMWLSSQWTVRDGGAWQDGEDYFFQHLLDGSRAANRLGWQWTTGVGSSKPYGFSRWQVDKRAPSLCDGCVHRDACPIQDWPDDPEFVSTTPIELGRAEALPGTAGPLAVEEREAPDAVWLTAESIGLADPALLANPSLPAVFVFDEPLLARLQLSAKRLVFLVETLAELGDHREVELLLGRPVAVLGERRLAVTHAPVPGFARRAASLDIAELHPWPWLTRPTTGSVRSFSAWRKGVARP